MKCWLNCTAKYGPEFMRKNMRWHIFRSLDRDINLNMVEITIILALEPTVSRMYIKQMEFSEWIGIFHKTNSKWESRQKKPHKKLLDDPKPISVGREEFRLWILLWIISTEKEENAKRSERQILRKQKLL